MAISILAAAILATGCSDRAAVPSAGSIAASRPSASATTAADPSPTMSPSPVPAGRLAFQRAIGDRESLFTINAAGSDEKPLLHAGVSPRWSPDGRHISVVADNRQGRLFFGLVDPDGSDYVQYDAPDPTLDLGCFAWSPDGSRLACEGWDDSDPTRTGMYTVRGSDGGDLVRVTACPNRCHDIPADYSPDGTQIVFTRQNPLDEADIRPMIVNADGSDAHELSDQKVWGGRLSPDGKTILTGSNGSLVLVPIDGSETHRIGIDSAANLNPEGGAWSPDGQWIVFSGHSDTGFDLYIMRTDGTHLHQVTDTHSIWEGDADWTDAAPV